MKGKDKITIENYFKQNNKELEKAKQFILLQIAQNDIRFINIHRLADYITDIYYKSE